MSSVTHQRGLTLHDLLSLIAGVAGCSASVIAGNNETRPVTGWIIGLPVGLFACVVVWKFGRWTIQRLKIGDPKLPFSRLILSWLFFLVLCALIVASALLGFWVTKTMIHVLA